MESSKVRRRSKRNQATDITPSKEEDLSDESAKENKRFQQVHDDDDDELVKKEILSPNELESNKNSPSSSKLNSTNESTKGLIVNLPKLNQTNLDLSFKTTVEFDLISILLFIVAFATRTYKLWLPKNIVFDELNFGKYVSMYMKNVFFFDQHPPLGKQLIAGMAYFAGFDGNYTFTKIGAEYSPNVPVFAMRFVPALCGSLLVPVVYKLLLQMKLSRTAATIGAVLVILDNALLTQSRFILLESMLLLFSCLGLLFLLQLFESRPFYLRWWLNAFLSALFLTATILVKYVGFYTICLAVVLICRYLWKLLSDRSLSDTQLVIRTGLKAIVFGATIVTVYLLSFYIHLSLLTKAGPHDSIMTSAFQASLEGGLASITKGQPVTVVHGSQITLRHTHGRVCWLHSHPLLYPVRYPDNRGSSHQQQVTCYSFKDVNNWWIVKKPTVSNLVVGDPPEPIRDGDEIQLVHGITSRALNSHDVAAAMSPHSQEVSCYIDYNVSMPAQILWRVDIINKEYARQPWHAITSTVRLVHVTTGLALKFSGKQLPDWGYNQHEIVADKIIEQQDTVWNVEEHRYTKAADAKEREMQMLKAEMIPTTPTELTFMEKFMELQKKMLWFTEKAGTTHMYSSEPLEWPLMSKGIAYWVARDSNAQIHLLGNVVIWYSGVLSIVCYFVFWTFYILRRHRKCYDIPESEWQRFLTAGETLFIGYFIHYLPYFFMDRTLFLHNYLPALVFKLMLLCFVIDHMNYLIKYVLKRTWMQFVFALFVALWLIAVFWVYSKFLVLSYGTTKLTGKDIVDLRWKDTWDFILHKEVGNK